MFREQLPCDCPPEEAWEIVTRTIMYRLIKGDTPTTEDFHSFRKLNPNAKVKGVSECQIRGLSVYCSPSDAKRKSKYRDEMYRICAIELDQGAGRVIKSGRNHYTWWPRDDFEILDRCRVFPR